MSLEGDVTVTFVKPMSRNITRWGGDWQGRGAWTKKSKFSGLCPNLLKGNSESSIQWPNKTSSDSSDEREWERTTELDQKLRSRVWKALRFPRCWLPCLQKWFWKAVLPNPKSCFQERKHVLYGKFLLQCLAAFKGEKAQLTDHSIHHSGELGSHVRKGKWLLSPWQDGS